MNIHLGVATKSPTHSTVLLWVKKYGHYELNRPKQEGGDWVVILDESIQFGQNKLLVVYGVRQRDIDFSRPLNYQDLSTLALISKSTWSGQDIKETLEGVQKQIGNIKYAVADYGNAIKKAVKLMGVPHVYDLTHCISLSLEHIYKEDPEFKEYTKKMAHLRGTQALGRMAHVLPPSQRAKARFMNLRPISDWGMAVLDLLDQPNEHFVDEKNNLAWVAQHRGFIMELGVLNKMVNAIQSVLKTKGISTRTVKECSQILRQANTERLRQFKKTMTAYFKQTIKSLPDTDPILCSSDVLESSFGKYKNYLQDNPMVGITNLCLSIAAFTGVPTSDQIKNAVENTTVNDINEWTKHNIGKTTLSKRIEVLKMG